ncbi:pilus assembly protein TadG-related protein [Janibacter sp. G368]|uniref:pilus assembly protein TadG-related protein n=1 Tax=Janibacter sp. G368 TaxID=3420441 RepID=UPI003D05141B
MTSLRSRARDDSGQLSLLIMGLTVIALTLIIGALAVTSVHISRMRLLDAADSAALGATDDSAELVYERGLDSDLPLDDATVQESAAEHLASRPLPHGLESWQVADGTGSPDGRTAVVRLTGEADLPLIGGLLQELGGSVTVTVESRARAGVTSG